MSYSKTIEIGNSNASFTCTDIETYETKKTDEDTNLSLAAGLFIAIAILVVIVVIVVLVYFIAIIGKNL